jgi:hypothetical protein
LACLASAASLGALVGAGAISGFPVVMNGMVSPWRLAAAVPASAANPVSREPCEQRAWPYIDAACLSSAANPRQQASHRVRIISTDRIVASPEDSRGSASLNEQSRIVRANPLTVSASPIAEAGYAPAENHQRVFAAVTANQEPAAEFPERLAAEQPSRDRIQTAPSLMWRRVKLTGADETAATESGKPPMVRRVAAQPPAIAARDLKASMHHQPMYDSAEAPRRTGRLRARQESLRRPVAYPDPARQRSASLDSALDAYFSPLSR